MNVDDIKGDVIPTDFSDMDRLDMIFSRQHMLMKKYLPIEVKNGLCHTEDCPVDLHDRFGQSRLKDFFWRITEELGEAVEANRLHPDLRNHMLEELADALHFLVECNLLAGINPLAYPRRDATLDGGLGCQLEYICKHSDDGLTLDDGCFEIVYNLTLASNCLKNRPWKQNHQLADTLKFLGYLSNCLPLLISIFVSQGLTADEIFRMYWKKSEVNKFRQRSNY